MGVVLELRLALSIAKVLKIDQNLLTFWSDSMNVLWWIRILSCSFRPLVANQIGGIHDSSSPTQWCHVSTHQNPADLPSPITPNHFLIAQVGGQFAPGSVDSGQFSPKKRWKQMQELVQYFWHRWPRE